MGKYLVIQLPAGFIDEGETPQESAVRELREGTGFLGYVVPTESNPPTLYPCKHLKFQPAVEWPACKTASTGGQGFGFHGIVGTFAQGIEMARVLGL